MLAALVFALVGQLFQLFEHGFVSLAGGKNDRKQRKIVVFVRLYQLGADLLRVLPPVIKRLLPFALALCLTCGSSLSAYAAEAKDAEAQISEESTASAISHKQDRF